MTTSHTENSDNPKHKQSRRRREEEEEQGRQEEDHRSNIEHSSDCLEILHEHRPFSSKDQIYQWLF